MEVWPVGGIQLCGVLPGCRFQLGILFEDFKLTSVFDSCIGGLGFDKWLWYIFLPT